MVDRESPRRAAYQDVLRVALLTGSIVIGAMVVAHVLLYG